VHRSQSRHVGERDTSRGKTPPLDQKIKIGVNIQSDWEFSTLSGKKNSDSEGTESTCECGTYGTFFKGPTAGRHAEKGQSASKLWLGGGENVKG